MNKFSFILLTIILVFSANNHASETNTFDIKQYEGKVVYLDFWASWCIPCRKSFPWLNNLSKKYSSDELIVIAVNLDKKRVLATEFLNKYPADFKIIYDPKGLLAKKYKIKGMPSSVLFGKDGKPKFAHKGFFPKKIASYENEIAKLISQ